MARYQGGQLSFVESLQKNWLPMIFCSSKYDIFTIAEKIISSVVEYIKELECVVIRNAQNFY